MDEPGLPQECNCPPPGAPGWMATFADMMSLLVCFFVLLLSFANMDIVKFKKAMGSMKEALGVEQIHVGEYYVRSTTPIELSDKQSTPFVEVTDMPKRLDAPTMDQRMMAEIQRVIASQGVSKLVETEASERGIIVRLKGQMLFSAGSDELHPEAFIFLDEIANLAEGFPYALSIEGHTDDTPINTARYASNWHLSTARAIAALRYLVDVAGIDPRRVSASGYADTRPLAPNDSPENRARNRRVEFVYLRDARLSLHSEGNAERPAEHGKSFRPGVSP